MKEFLLRLQSQFQKYWQGLSMQQKIMVVSLALVILSSIVAASFYMTKPAYAPLFTNLPAEDASGIINKLKETKIPFTITDGGKTIRVPEKNVHETRLLLAGQGLPQGGSIGFEIFDKTFFGMTEFNQRLNYQRALQGELERTIRQVSAVDHARVHLVLPEKTLYAEKERAPTASVIIKLKPSAQLDKGQIKAIVNLIKTSVEGLKDNNVSIVDTNGHILSSVWENDGYNMGPEILTSQFELKRNVERTVKDEIIMMLDRVLGPGKAVVNVNVDLDLTKREATAEIFTPTDDVKKTGIVRSIQERSENFKGSGSSSGQGVPGTASNVGTTPGYQSSSSSSGGNSDFTKDETITNYEINKKVEHSISVPGEVKRLTISVLLDGTYPEATVTSIKQAVSSAVGISLQRGDSVVVESLQFDKTHVELEKKDMERSQRQDLIFSGMRTGSIIFVTIVILLFGMSMVRHRKVVAASTAEIEKAHEMAQQGGLIGDGGVVSGQAGLSLDQPQDDLGQQIGQQIESLAREKPERIAEVIKDLMSGA